MSREADQPGRYIARVLDRAVNRTGQNELLTVVLRFTLLSREQGGQYIAMEDEEQEIVGYFYLEKKDGTLNMSAIKSLSAAFGWAQGDPFWFEDVEILPDVKLTLAIETYDGTDRLRVKWVDSLEGIGGGGVRRAAADERLAIQAKYGARFRAIAKPVPVPTPARAAGATARAALPTNSLVPEVSDYIGPETGDQWAPANG